jgi:hypothetical protein
VRAAVDSTVSCRRPHLEPRPPQPFKNPRLESLQFPLDLSYPGTPSVLRQDSCLLCAVAVSAACFVGEGVVKAVLGFYLLGAFAPAGHTHVERSQRPTALQWLRQNVPSPSGVSSLTPSNTLACSHCAPPRSVAHRHRAPASTPCRAG